MAYKKDIRIPHMSNPNVQFKGNATGTKESHAEPSYNAKTINQTAWRVADYKYRVDKPLITKEPSGGILNQGDTFKLSIKAEGTDLGYEWFKDGKRLYRYQSSLTIWNAEHSDDGAYYVIVSNSAGSVKSKEAILEYNKPPIISRYKPAQHTTFLPEGEIPVSITCYDPDGEIQSVNISNQKLTPNNKANWAKSGDTVTTTWGVTMPDKPNHEIQAAVSDDRGGKTSITIQVKRIVIRPVYILVHPTDQQVNKGGTVTFTVKASGTGPFTYRWKRNGKYITAEQNSPELIIRNATESDVGDYQVVVKNSVGSAVSRTAFLYFNRPPTLIYQQDNLEVILGKPAKLQVIAGGTKPLTFSWSKGGVLIRGASEPKYSIPAVNAKDDGIYRVLVKNAAGQVESGPIRLVVILPPAILIHPGDQVVDYGSDVKLTARVTGTEPLSYIWRRGDHIVGHFWKRETWVNSLN